MTKRELVLIAAAAAFSLAGIASVNDSEAINVALPSQYRTVWDQSLHDTARDEAEAVRPAGRLWVDMPGAGNETFGPFARNLSRRWPDRG